MESLNWEHFKSLQVQDAILDEEPEDVDAATETYISCRIISSARLNIVDAQVWLLFDDLYQLSCFYTMEKLVVAMH